MNKSITFVLKKNKKWVELVSFFGMCACGWWAFLPLLSPYDLVFASPTTPSPFNGKLVLNCLIFSKVWLHEIDIDIVCRFFPDKATSLASEILNELVEVSSITFHQLQQNGFLYIHSSETPSKGKWKLRVEKYFTFSANFYMFWLSKWNRLNTVS